MAKTTIWREINESFNRSEPSQRQLKYFRWKHQLDTNRYTYSEMSQEDFQKQFNLTDIQFHNLMKWESSAKYKRLTFLLKEDEFADDLLEVYDEVKNRAIKETDGQAIKNMLLLQKEIKDYRQGIDELEDLEDEEEDDGLIV